MTTTPRQLCQYVAPLVETTVYGPVPVGTRVIVTNVVVANTSGTAATISLSAVPAGGAGGVANRLIPAQSVAANTMLPINLSTVLEAGGFLSSLASVAGMMAVTISGLLVSAQAVVVGVTPPGVPGVTTAFATTSDVLSTQDSEVHSSVTSAVTSAISTLTDTFSTTLNLTRWNRSTAGVVITGGRVRLDVNVTVPAVPTGTSAVGGNGSAVVSWGVPSSDGGSAIIDYTVTSSPGGLTATATGAGATSVTITGLTNGTAYVFTVKARNIAGNSAASSSSNVVTPG